MSSFKKNVSILEILNTDLISKKLVNKTWYPKSYIRGDLLKNKKLKLIDQHTNSFIIENELVKSYLNHALTDCLGVSINSQQYKFKHCINDSVQFTQSMHLFSGASVFCLSSFLLSLSTFTNAKNKFRALLILSPIRGGFRCYCLGMMGFLSVAHGRALFNQNQAYNLNSVFKSFTQTVKVQRYFIFRFPFTNGTLYYSPRLVKRIFSLKKKFHVQHEIKEKLTFSFQYPKIKKTLKT